MSNPGLEAKLLAREQRVVEAARGFHVQPEIAPSPDRTAFVDLFSGGGGASIGAARAPHTDVVFHAECNEDCFPLLHHHFPCAALWAQPLGGCTRELLRAILITVSKYGHVHLHGSPPCQGFSKARRNAAECLAEHATNLVQWFLDFVPLLKAAVNPGVKFSWSIENVNSGAVKKLMRGAKIEPQLLRAYHFGAPTMRARLFGGEGWAVKKGDRCDSVTECMVRGGAWTNADAIADMRSGKLVVGSTGPSFSRPVYCKEKKGYVGYRRVNLAAGENVRVNDIPAFTLTCHVRPWWCIQNAEGKWWRFRIMETDEICVFQGFPCFYFHAVWPDLRKTRKIGKAMRVLGNAVVPGIMTAIVASSQLS